MKLTYKRKQKFALINVYEINISYMHGDADCYTYNTAQLHDFSESQVIEYIKKFNQLAALINCEDVNVNDYVVNDTRIELEHDVVYGWSRYASMKIESIIYYNKDGVVFDVTYE